MAKKLSHYYTRGDFIVTLVLGTLSAASAFAIRLFSKGSKHVRVEVDGAPAFEAPLSDETRIEAVEGPLGKTEFKVGPDGVAVTASPCPNKYCVRMGKISHGGEAVICVPNHVIITITGGSETEKFDSVTQ